MASCHVVVTLNSTTLPIPSILPRHPSPFFQLVFPVTDELPFSAKRLCKGAHLDFWIVRNDGKLRFRVRIVRNDTKLLYLDVSFTTTLNYATTSCSPATTSHYPTSGSSKITSNCANNTPSSASLLCSERLRSVSLVSNVAAILLLCAYVILTLSL